MSIFVDVIEYCEDVPLVGPLLAFTMTSVFYLFGIDLPPKTPVKPHTWTNSTRQFFSDDLPEVAYFICVVVILLLISSCISACVVGYAAIPANRPKLIYFCKLSFANFVKLIVWLSLYWLDDSYSLGLFTAYLPYSALPCLLQLGFCYADFEYAWSYGLTKIQIVQLVAEEVLMTVLLYTCCQLGFFSTFLLLFFINSFCLMVMAVFHMLSFINLPGAGNILIANLSVVIRIADGLQLVCGSVYIAWSMFAAAGSALHLIFAYGLLYSYIVKRLWGVVTGRPYRLAGVVLGAHIMGV